MAQSSVGAAVGMVVSSCMAVDVFTRRSLSDINRQVNVLTVHEWRADGKARLILKKYYYLEIELSLYINWRLMRQRYGSRLINPIIGIQVV